MKLMKLDLEVLKMNGYTLARWDGIMQHRLTSAKFLFAVGFWKRTI